MAAATAPTTICRLAIPPPAATPWPRSQAGQKPLVAREADKREQARPGEPEWHAVVELPVEPGAGAFVLWKRHTLTSSFNSPVLSAKAAHSTPVRFSMVTNKFVMGT